MALQVQAICPLTQSPKPLNSKAACPQGPLPTAHGITLDVTKYFLGANMQSPYDIKSCSEYSKESEFFFGGLCILIGHSTGQQESKIKAQTFSLEKEKLMCLNFSLTLVLLAFPP